MRDSSVRNFMIRSEEKETHTSKAMGGSLRDLVARAGLGYVVVHQPYSSEKAIIEYLEKNMSLERFYDRDGVVAYKIVE